MALHYAKWKPGPSHQEKDAVDRATGEEVEVTLVPSVDVVPPIGHINEARTSVRSSSMRSSRAISVQRCETRVLPELTLSGQVRIAQLVYVFRLVCGAVGMPMLDTC